LRDRDRKRSRSLPNALDDTAFQALACRSRKTRRKQRDALYSALRQVYVEPRTKGLEATRNKRRTANSREASATALAEQIWSEVDAREKLSFPADFPTEGEMQEVHVHL
jgi:hypothetical protein